VRLRAEQVAARLVGHGVACEVVESEASVGGGAFPTARIPSHAIAVAGQAEAIERKLRLGTSPVIGRIANGRVLLDLRSVPAAHDEHVVRAVVASLA
jgi:L-seryl-tRNA(Ser) seleniumtransferase